MRMSGQLSSTSIHKHGRVLGRVHDQSRFSTVKAPVMILASVIKGRCEGMIRGAIIAEVAALVGDPARATILSSLLDGCAMTASELALAARITPQTASAHLAKLTKAGLLLLDRNGRHRYFRLASPKVAEMIEGIVAVALEKRPRFRQLSPQARAVFAARMCWTNLTGRLRVAVAGDLVARDTRPLGDNGDDSTNLGVSVL